MVLKLFDLFQEERSVRVVMAYVVRLHCCGERRFTAAKTPESLAAGGRSFSEGRLTRPLLPVKVAERQQIV